MYVRRDSRNNETPTSTVSIVVMAKICSSATIVLFPIMITNKMIRSRDHMEFALSYLAE